LFEELSGIMRTVLASRSEIVEYDKRQLLAVSEKPYADTKVRVRLFCSNFFFILKR